VSLDATGYYKNREVVFLCLQDDVGPEGAEFSKCIDEPSFFNQFPARTVFDTFDDLPGPQTPAWRGPGSCSMGARMPTERSGTVVDDKHANTYADAKGRWCPVHSCGAQR
jgi:hypothetical protein